MTDNVEINEKDRQLAIQRLNDFGIYWFESSQPYAQKLANELRENGFPNVCLYELSPLNNFAITKEEDLYTLEDLMLMSKATINEKKLH